ncbi:MAG: UDP-3-O-[3-hydroxymyristoyl] N-acetylglucosamine deacetylase [Victivallales bacterium]|nr:UDP-3-O-[3-hydroxymyristoyl] N-acetylglucosamine deacetylase [Victivallales bacterium]
MEEMQNTLKRETGLSGIALHTGVRANLTLRPAEKDRGIVFRRVDLPGKPSVKALAQNVVDIRRGTTIASGDATVCTVEHVLATLNACGIDNALVDMDGPEPPIADGSALPYLDIVSDAGVAEQDAAARSWTPGTVMAFEDNGSISVVIPNDGGLKISCMVEYPSYALGTQYYSALISFEEFAANLAPARTLVEFRDLEKLIAMGLVKGGSLDNAIVIHEGALISKENLRFPDEIVRHKVLDIIGDMALLGLRLNAHLLSIRPGHASNVCVAKELAKLISP